MGACTSQTWQKHAPVECRDSETNNFEEEIEKLGNPTTRKRKYGFKQSLQLEKLWFPWFCSLAR